MRFSVLLLFSVCVFGQTFDQKMNEFEKRNASLSEDANFAGDAISEEALSSMGSDFVILARDVDDAYRLAMMKGEKIDIKRFNQLKKKMKSVASRLIQLKIQLTEQEMKKTHGPTAHAFSFLPFV